MCTVCGCAGSPATIEAGQATPDPRPSLDFGANAARVCVPGLSTERTLTLEADVLGANDAVAQRNRRHFETHGVRALNLISSPGSGKTTLLVATLRELRQRLPDLALAVIEGDQQTSHDAERIRATGVPAVQVNTGKGCHLDAPMIEAAFARLPLHDHDHAHAHDHTHEHAHGHGHAHEHEHGHRADRRDAGPVGVAGRASAAPAGLLFIENVGNLVCPALWDLGEQAKVAILSVTEGEDKPAKYPDAFAAASLMVLTKVDLLPHVSFDVAKCLAYARRINPGIEIIELSATTGQGMARWLDWLAGRAAPAAAGAAASAVEKRIAHLEAELKALRRAQALGQA